MSRRNIFLVGPMGAGKTTVGKELARALAMTFVDSDHEIERRTGAKIPLIFELEGEAGFRARERQAIDELTQGQNIVLATGGGAVLDPDNRRHLRERGVVVYLRGSVDQLIKRTAKDRNRPLLQTADPHAKLTELLRQRGPLYEEVASIMLDTDTHAPKSLVKKLLALLRKQ